MPFLTICVGNFSSAIVHGEICSHIEKIHGCARLRVCVAVCGRGGIVARASFGRNVPIERRARFGFNAAGAFRSK